MGNRILKVYEASGCQSLQVPCILLRGQWLKQLGFSIGDRITVTMNSGQLIIDLIQGQEEAIEQQKIRKLV
ncbi:MAG: hypothetical protein APF81_01710 [Desulfosporosinus sp. BRH_c37]|nr:MAG: hypothetical protein APF81_01710 [Desulfosporosinus sp. BRH_c37]